MLGLDSFYFLPSLVTNKPLPAPNITLISNLAWSDIGSMDANVPVIIHRSNNTIICSGFDIIPQIHKNARNRHQPQPSV